MHQAQRLNTQLWWKKCNCDVSLHDAIAFIFAICDDVNILTVEQFELMEVARPFLLGPGNEAS